MRGESRVLPWERPFAGSWQTDRHRSATLPDTGPASQTGAPDRWRRTIHVIRKHSIVIELVVSPTGFRSAYAFGMPKIASDIVEVLPVRWHNGAFQVYLMDKPEAEAVPGGRRTIQGRIERGETTIEAAKRLVSHAVGQPVAAIYSLDHVHHILDHHRDLLVLAPVLAVTLSAPPRVSVGLWLALDEGLAQLPLANDREALQRAHDLLHLGGADRSAYRLT